MGLVGDIGATNARLAVVAPDGSMQHCVSMLCADHASLAEAIRAYLQQAGLGVPERAVLAVATTPQGDDVAFTNNSWSFSKKGLRSELGLADLAIINDFHANALAVPRLRAEDRMQVGSGSPRVNAPIGILGPGSGLGVSTVVEHEGRFIAVPGEGGHVTMSPCDDEESAVLGLLRRRFDHVSAERVLSGPGLVNLYEALCELHGYAGAPKTAAQICDPRTIASDVCAKRTTEMFCAMLGTVAGNLALTLGAHGGIYIAGGIVPRFGASFADSTFRSRFEDKGRFRTYLAGIPTYVITRPHAALLGAAALLDRANG
jgi:glucokinase